MTINIYLSPNCSHSTQSPLLLLHVLIIVCDIVVILYLIILLLFHFNLHRIQDFALNSDSYLEMDYPLDMRSFGFRADYSYYPGGYIGQDLYGWHLSYFMSLKDMVRKVESFSAAAEVSADAFKSEEHIRYCMTHHKDLFNRTEDSAKWVGFFDDENFEGDPSTHLPEGWEAWQEKLNIIQEEQI
jgi:hypothetical protein